MRVILASCNICRLPFYYNGVYPDPTMLKRNSCKYLRIANWRSLHNNELYH